MEVPIDGGYEPMISPNYQGQSQTVYYQHPQTFFQYPTPTQIIPTPQFQNAQPFYPAQIVSPAISPTNVQYPVAPSAALVPIPNGLNGNGVNNNDNNNGQVEDDDSASVASSSTLKAHPTVIPNPDFDPSQLSEELITEEATLIPSVESLETLLPTQNELTEEPTVIPSTSAETIAPIASTSTVHPTNVPIASTLTAQPTVINNAKPADSSTAQPRKNHHKSSRGHSNNYKGHNKYNNNKKHQH
jgi:hypothetical protein